MSRWLVSGRTFVLATCLSVVLSACGSASQPSGCTVDADCTGNAWCQEGSCQAAYMLAVATTPTAAADAKVHANGVVQLRVQVSGGGGTGPAAVTLSFVDEGRLQSVGPPDYAYAWDTTTANEGSHRVKATVAAGSRTYESQMVEVVVDRTPPPAPVPNPLPAATNANPVVMTGTAEEKTTLRVMDGATQLTSLEVPNGGTWAANLSLAEGTHVLIATATDAAGNTSPATAPATVLVDRTQPAAPAVDPIPSPTNAHTLLATGTAEAGTSVEVSVNGAPVAGTVPATGGTWRKEISFATSGRYDVKAAAIDAAGNRSPDSAVVSVTVDQTMLTPPSLVVKNPTNEEPIPVSGATLPGAVVRVYEGASLAATSQPADPQGRWSAWLAGFAEGSHSLTLTASNGVTTSDPSAPVALVVDRTHPHVVLASRTPQPSAPNIWSRDPITVTFDEDMAEVPAGAVTMVARDDAGQQVTLSPVLRMDGRTLTLTTPVLPPVPSHVTLTLNPVLADRAGNGLDPTGATWEWDLAEWHDLGGVTSSTYLRPSALALSPAGHPWTADLVCDGFCNVYVNEWTGGGGWARRALVTGTAPSIDVDANGNAAVAWTGYTASPPQLGIAKAGRWEGSAFTTQDLNTAAAATSPVASAPSIAVDRVPGQPLSGNHVAAWLENQGGVNYVFAKRWDGAWTQMGSGALSGDYGATASTPVVSVDAGGGVRVTWLESDAIHSKSWNPASGAWVLDGYVSPDSSPNPARSSYAYRVSPASVPYRAFLEATSATPSVALLKVETKRIGATCATNWCVLGGSVNGGALNHDLATSVSSYGMAFDAAGRPVVAWVEGGALWVKRWDGVSTWQLVAKGGFLPIGYVLSSATPAIAVNADGVIAVTVVVAPSQSATSRRVWVKRFNR